MDKNNNTCHAEEIRLLLDKLACWIGDIEDELELLSDLHKDIGSEFEAYSDETDELEYALAQCTDELERTREFIPKSDKKEILQKLFMFDTVTPMTQPERIAVYNAVLSGQETTVDVCWSAGHYLNEYRRNSRQSEECELPFDTSVEELVANLL
jgi:hypothetical protein